MTVTEEIAGNGAGIRMRLRDIDGLKAFAIASIVVYETARYAGVPGASEALGRLIGDAGQALALFLLLSGFALAYPVLAALRGDGSATFDVGRYAVKRLLRVYPAYAVAVGVVAALHPIAVLFGLPALANGVPSVDAAALVRAVVFLGDGFGNDGFRAIALVVRGYLLFPVLLVLWTRAPRFTLILAVFAAVADVLTPAHAWTVSALVPLILGIAAADLRARPRRFVRFAFPLAAVAASLAFAWEPRAAMLAGNLAAPGALRVDPFWSIAFFGLVVGIGTVPVLQRVAGFAPFRFAGAASYAISLVAMPVAAFAARQLPATLSWPAAAATTAAATAIVGLVLWQCVDRWFGDARLRTSVAERPGAWFDARLARFGIALLEFRAPLQPEEPAERTASAANGIPDPPPIPPRLPRGERAIFTTRTGSADDLATEIQETKRRLADAASYAPHEPEEPVPEPALGLEARDAGDDDLERPGFYRRPPGTARASSRPSTPRLELAAPPSPAEPAGSGDNDATAETTNPTEDAATRIAASDDDIVVEPIELADEVETIPAIVQPAKPRILRARIVRAPTTPPAAQQLEPALGVDPDPERVKVPARPAIRLRIGRR